MAEAAYVPVSALPVRALSEPVRHPAIVRTTHWITALAFVGLLISGVAILLAHPRLYWGETGNLETPSLIDLPLPFVLRLQSGWGRSLHFISAWVSVTVGIIYVLWGLTAGHFRRNLVPAKPDFSWRAVSRHLLFRRPGPEEALAYNDLQRIAYLSVIFVLFPLVTWTGLAMSPAITSVFPAIVTVWGGQQSARTIHFFVSSLLVVFLFVHLAMVCLAGFTGRVGAMITGRAVPREHV